MVREPIIVSIGCSHAYGALLLPDCLEALSDHLVFKQTVEFGQIVDKDQ